MIEIKLNELKAAIESATGHRAKRTSQGYSLRCPAHGDGSPSLSLTATDDRILIHCHAGCGFKDILAAVGFSESDCFAEGGAPKSKPRRKRRDRGYKPRVFDTAEEALGSTRLGKPDRVWWYRRSNGEIVGAYGRWQAKPGRKKELRPARKDPDGWRLKAMDEPRPLYNLPALKDAQCVLVVEGEKAADAAIKLSYVATTSPSGSNGAARADWAPLAGKSVVILPDNDESGRKYAEAVRERLAALRDPPTVKVLELPGMEHGEDIVDFIREREALGHCVEDLLRDIDELIRRAPEIRELPTVVLPGGATKINDSAKQLADLLVAQGEYYVRGGVMVRVVADGRLEMVRPTHLPSVFETVANLRRNLKDKLVATTCSKSVAESIQNSVPFREGLPTLTAITASPVIMDRKGQLHVVSGYDPQSGILAKGVAPPEMPLADARHRLLELLADFRFAAEADRARAVASLITPALQFGGLLRGRAPLEMTEADEPQAGKGYRNRLVAAIYKQRVVPVTQKKGGVGSLEETVSQALVSGASFISIDNMRGKVDSPFLESLLTEESVQARVPYAPAQQLDPSQTVFMLTTNRGEMTEDLARRASCVRLLKQPSGYRFRKYPEGDLLDHVAANASLYQGAVFAVIRAWHSAGANVAEGAFHDFRRWAGIMHVVCVEILNIASPFDDYRREQRRLSNPHLGWLREVALVVERAGRLGAELSATEISHLLVDYDVELPVADVDIDDDDGRRMLARAVGRKVRSCLAGEEMVTFDQYRLFVSESTDQNCRKRSSYRFEGLEGESTPKDCLDPKKLPDAAQPFPNKSQAPEGEQGIFSVESQVGSIQSTYQSPRTKEECRHPLGDLGGTDEFRDARKSNARSQPGESAVGPVAEPGSPEGEESTTSVPLAQQGKLRRRGAFS